MIKAVPANACGLFQPCIHRYNRAVSFVARHTFEWVARLEAKDTDSAIGKTGKVFLSFLCAATIVPFVGLFVAAGTAHLLKCFRPKPAPAPAHQPPVNAPIAQPQVQQVAAQRWQQEVEEILEPLRPEIPQVREAAPQPPPQQQPEQPQQVVQEVLQPQQPEVVLQQRQQEAEERPREPLYPVLELPQQRQPLIEQVAGVIPQPLPVQKDPAFQIVEWVKDLSSSLFGPTSSVALNLAKNRDMSGDMKALEEIINCLNSPNENVSVKAVTVILSLVTTCKGNKNAIQAVKGVQKLSDFISRTAKENFHFLALPIGTVAALAMDDENIQNEIEKTLIIPKLIELLNDELLKIPATLALIVILKNTEWNREMLQKADIIRTLVPLLKDPNEDVQRRSIQWLTHLVTHHPESQTKAGQAGAIPPLKSLLEDPSSATWFEAGLLLSAIVKNTPENQDEARRSGVVDLLVGQFLKGKSENKAHLASILSDLASGNPANQNAIASVVEVIPELTSLLSSKAPMIRSDAVLLLKSLAEGNSINQVVIGERALAAIVPLINDLLAETKILTLELIRVLVLNNKKNQENIGKSGAIKNIVQLFDGVDSGVKTQAILTLRALAKENPANQKIIKNSGVIGTLQAQFRNNRDVTSQILADCVAIAHLPHNGNYSIRGLKKLLPSLLGLTKE